MPNTIQSIYNFNKTNENLRYKTLQEVDNICKYCHKCDLSKTRTNVVFGAGIFSSKIMLIGEGPGQQEDQNGRPFIGKAGKFLDKLLESQDISREKNIYICNIVKCRPPDNRQPLPNEMGTCKQILLAHQINIIRPTIICTLGASALTGLMEKPFKITKVRGQLLSFGTIKLIPTYHPAYILRNPKELTQFAEDLTLVALSATPKNQE